MNLLTQALSPYDQNDDLSRPGKEWQGEWDSWWIYNGHHEKCFFVKAGLEHDDRLVRVILGPRGEMREIPLSRCDGGPVALLDFNTEISRVEALEAARWNRLAELAQKYPEAASVDEIYRQACDAGKPSMLEVQKRYLAQEFVTAAASAEWLPSTYRNDVFDPVGWLQGGIDQFVESSRLNVFPTDAILNLDGDWMDSSNFHAEGSGVWRDGDMKYRRYFTDYLQSLDDGEFVVRVLYRS
ncbi:hypothetical protein OG897_26955 [Streptomyces sp. NBC_00237]|uniref:hypothetical protein n=1 Tax=Streptomyces sp. NBC_00237 TaxID=2975687 RepID=UPI0022592BD4|nr:hypothetical protein [Streptomyces sp. NBC_00237]MCX5205082.1 hypothetical protein [Streptomyces sp. NBC_00237]